MSFAPRDCPNCGVPIRWRQARTWSAYVDDVQPNAPHTERCLNLPPDLVKQERDNLEAIIGLPSRRVVDCTLVDVMRNSGPSRVVLFEMQDAEAQLVSALAVEKLRRAYEDGEQLPPIAVVPGHETGRWLVKDGHHRIGAALLAGVPFLPALVLAT